MALSVVWLLITIVAMAMALPLREGKIDNLEQRNSGAVKFYLYTKKNPTVPQELFLNNVQSVTNSNFLSSRHTKVIIHGWTMSYTKIPNPELRDAYLKQGDYNVISVDWNAYAKLNYISARAKVPVVGEDLAEFLDFLNLKFNLSYEKLVVVGHSLGAHVAGYCGKNVKAAKLSAIVGLDPAYPLYSYDNKDTRLNSEDAKYVQSIQTSGNIQGFLKPIGSAAFYPNWGRQQAGCGADLDGGCAHARCVFYYAEAIVGYSYSPVTTCDSFDNILKYTPCTGTNSNTIFGDPMNITRKNGIFYFQTNPNVPYGHK